MKYVLTAYIFCDFQIFSNDHILYFKRLFKRKAEHPQKVAHELMSQGPEGNGAQGRWKDPQF